MIHQNARNTWKMAGTRFDRVSAILCISQVFHHFIVIASEYVGGPLPS